jgi:lipopolysaccharide biosynthesis regulator YciM
MEKEELKLILENFISLQSVLTNLAEKIDKLTKQLSTLLNLFEKAAEKFSESQGMKEEIEEKDLLNKLDKLMEENKTIAKALTLIEEKIRRTQQTFS